MKKITAHSGCDSTPDNSIAYLKYALQSKADSIEADIRKNSSGLLVLGHDKESNVTLQQAFELLREHPEKKLNCDLKEENLEEKVYELAQKMKVEKQLIYSGNVDLLKCRHQTGFENVEVYMNIENVCLDVYEKAMNHMISENLEEAISRISESGIHVINIEYHLVNDELIRMIKKYDLNLSVWTVNDAEDMKAILQYPSVINMTTRNLKEALSLWSEQC